MNYKIAQLAVSPEQKTDTISKIFISQPAAEEEALLGRLFIVVDLKTNHPEMVRLVNFVIDQIKQNYYRNEQIILLQRTASVKVENIFESAIAKLNQNIVEYLTTEKIKFSVPNVNMTIGAIYKNELHLANLGRNKALLIYRSKNPNDELGFDLMDITKNNNESNKEIFNINKLFSNIINGSIPMGSYFLFANEALAEYLSENQLIKIITTLPPASAVEQIRNILLQTNVYVPFLALIIQNGRFGQEDFAQPANPIRARQTAPLPDRRPIPLQTEKEPGSIEALHLTEAKTAKLLSPTGLISFSHLKNIFNRLDLHRWKKHQYQNKLTFKGKLAFRPKINLRRFFNIAQLTASWAMGTAVVAYQTVTSKDKRQHFKQLVLARKNRLQRKHWIMLGIIGLTLIILIGNLTYNGLRSKKRAVQEAYQEQITTIQQKQSQIETDMMYDNLAGARDNLITIDQMLKALAQDTDAQKKTWQDLKNGYNQYYDQINNVTRLISPQLLATFATEQQPDSLIIVNNRLYASDSQKQTIYEFDLQQTTINVLLQDSNIKNVKSPAVDDNDNIYYISDNRSIVAIDPSTKKLDKLTGTEALSDPSALAIYNNRFYIFNQQTQQIVRYNRYNNQLDNGKDWLEDSSLRTISSISVNGFVWIISGNQIFKYGGGRPQEFILEEVMPALDQPDKIIALKDKEIFYVLEKANNRLIVFSQSGRFLAQYASDSFGEITDFAINEQANQVYVLAGQQLYQFPLYQ